MWKWTNIFALSARKVIRIATTALIRNTEPKNTHSLKPVPNVRLTMVNAYLKEYFQLNNIRHRGALAKVDFEMTCLTYTACKLTVNRLNQCVKTNKLAA